VVAFFYYATVARKMWFHDPLDDTVRETQTPAGLTVAIGLCTAIVIVVGVYPQLFARVGEWAFQL
jgi:NADH:ubiquinone oxidoreductase subunit 2 (subunit N)